MAHKSISCIYSILLLPTLVVRTVGCALPDYQQFMLDVLSHYRQGPQFISNNNKKRKRQEKLRKGFLSSLSPMQWIGQKEDVSKWARCVGPNSFSLMHKLCVSIIEMCQLLNMDLKPRSHLPMFISASSVLGVCFFLNWCYWNILRCCISSLHYVFNSNTEYI